jgi:hypothetical protein
MKKIIYIIIFIGFEYAHAQISDDPFADTLLMRYKKDICFMVLEQENLANTVNCSEIDKSIFIRKIKPISSNNNLNYYVLQLSVTHTKRFLCVVFNDKFEIFASQNFDEEFESIFKYFDHKDLILHSKNIYSFLMEVKAIYDYNNDDRNFNRIQIIKKVK